MVRRNTSISRKRALPVSFEVERLERRTLLSGVLQSLAFDGTGPIGPAAALTLSGGILYGTSEAGGPNNDGTVFSLPDTGGAVTVLASFNGITGKDPAADLAISGDTLYGTTEYGGADGEGEVFSVPITGGAPTVLASFGADGTHGQLPVGGLIVSGNTLYGTASFAGPTSENGVVFSLPTTGGSLTVLATFDRTDGGGPQGDLILSGDTLYGTTAFGGANDAGEVFSVPVAGGSPTVLGSFNGSDGADPRAGLTRSGNTFYGTTQIGGANNDGAVFSIPITGGAISLLASFDGTDGNAPYGGVTLLDGTLYGTTSAGGADHDGTVFSVPVTGGSPTVIASFGGANREEPLAGLTLDGDTFFGTTFGIDDAGSLFSLTIGTGGPDALAFANQPSSTTVGSSLGTITVDINNSSGNLKTGDNSTVSLAIASGPSGAILSGGLTATAAGGVATFTGLSLDTAGTYTLTATDGSDTAATSAAFTITSNGGGGGGGGGGVTQTSPTVSTLTSSANIFTVGQTCTLTCTVAPANGGPAPTGTITIFEDGVNKATETLGQNGSVNVTWTADAATPNAQVHFVYNGDSNYKTSTSNSITQTYLPLSQLGANITRAAIPSTAIAGQPYKAKLPVRFTNDGDLLTGAYSVVLYADTSTGGLSGHQVSLETLNKHLSLKANKSFTVKLSTRSLPATLPAGTYYLLAEITDPAGNSNLVNTAQTIGVSQPIVTLGATAGTVRPPTVAIAKSGTLVVTVTNNGNIRAAGPLTITLSPSSDGVSAIPGITLTTLVRHATLKPGKSGRYTLRFKVPPSLTSGLYYPLVSVSLDGQTATAAGLATFTVV